VDPTSGVVASANNPPPQTGDTAHLGLDWLDSYRHDRIVELLESRSDWDIAAAQVVQNDRMSLPWRELRETLLAVPGSLADTRRALDILRVWDGDVAASSAAAAVFELFLADMAKRAISAMAPRSAQWLLGEQLTPLLPRSIMAVRWVGLLVRLLREQPEGWLAAPWPREMAESLARAVRKMRTEHGDRAERWGWGRVRPLTLRHALGGGWLFRAIFDRGPFPFGGDTNTVCQASVDPFDPTGNPLYVPSLRMLLDVGHWAASRFSLPGGQSGNPLSPHYDDLLPYWRRGEGVPIAWDPADVARRSRTCLRLVPNNGPRVAALGRGTARRQTSSTEDTIGAVGADTGIGG
jgi:penicillin amidase